MFAFKHLFSNMPECVIPRFLADFLQSTIMDIPLRRAHLGAVYMEKIASASREFFLVRQFSICLYIREIASACGDYFN